MTPDLARSWEIHDGGRRYRFHLRETLRWSDGAPLTAEDWVFAWRRTLDPALDFPTASLLYDVRGARAYHRGETANPTQVGIRALAARTLEIELEGPRGYFLHLLTCTPTFPVPRHIVRQHDRSWTEPAME